jgi:hypothetical protein
MVVHRVPVRQVDTGDRLEAVPQIGPPARRPRPAAERLPVRLDDLLDDLLPLPDHDEVHERGDRLGVREGAHPEDVA